MLLPSISLLLFLFQITTHARLLNSNCSSTDTYLIGSTFESNLFKLLSSLSTNAITNSSFSADSYGSSSDEVYGLIMCFADSSLTNCANCIQYSTSNSTQPCSMSATSTVLYDSCMISYSRQDFRYVSESYSPYCLYSGKNSLDQNTTKLLRKLLSNLSVSAPNSSQMFASGIVNGMDIQGLMQCTRDLSAMECSRCISDAMLNFNFCSFNGSALGMRIMMRNCYVRYESYSFNVTSFPKSLVSPPPPPSPPLPPPPPPPVAVTSSPGGSKSNSAVIIAPIVVVVIVAVLAPIGIFIWRRTRIKTHGNPGDEDVMVLHENVEMGLEYILNPNTEYQVFDLIILKNASDNFSEINKLGKGGFGLVYKGTLPDGQELALKILSEGSRQGLKEFKNEVDLLVKLKHKNLVRLLGCCIQRNQKILCYEYLPKGSLDKILFAKDQHESAELDWRARFRIIEGICRGLNYLHEESLLKIIHRDLKPSNILLDKDMNPKISDFGLARFFEEDQTHKDTSVIAGTFGYMAPEYILYGNFSAKSDVYSFGMLVLEIVTGRKNSSFAGSGRGSNLIDNALQHWNNGMVSQLKDPILGNEYLDEIKRCVHAALLCVHGDPIDRPNMETVKNMLSGNSKIITDMPSAFSISKLVDFSLSDESSTRSTTNRNDGESSTTRSLTNTSRDYSM